MNTAQPGRVSMALSVNTLFNLLRATLLALAVLAVLVALAWRYAPQQIDRMDGWIVAHYSGAYQQRLRAARAQVGTNPRAAITQLEGLLDDLAGVKTQDRLAAVKRKAFSALVGVLDDLEDYPAAQRWARQWTLFDERDLKARVRYAMLLGETVATRADGVARMAKLYQRIPEVKMVALGYASLLDRAGAIGQAQAVYEAYSDAVDKRDAGSLRPMAEVFWDYGKGFSVRTRVQAVAVTVGAGRDGIFFGNQPGVRRLRLDPVASLFEPRLFLWDASGEHRVDLAAQRLSLHDMRTSDDGGLLVDGSDPYLVWTLPPAWTGKPLSLLLTGRLDERPAWLIEADAGSPAGAKGPRPDKPGAASSGTLADGRSARAVSLPALVNYPLELFWRDRDQPFSAQRKLRVPPGMKTQDGVTVLDARFELAARAAFLRVDLAPLPGFAYRLDGIEARADGDDYATRVIRRHDLVERDGWLTVTASDPYIVFALPGPGLSIKRVDVRVRVR